MQESGQSCRELRQMFGQEGRAEDKHEFKIRLRSVEKPESGVFGIRTYGIFPGAAREDDTVAVVSYWWEDYKRIFGGTVDDYKDFLLEREDFIWDPVGNQVVRVVEVPWDEEMYQDWLVRSGWEDSVEAHGAWALEVAKDRKALRALREKHPVPPAAPKDERIIADVSYMLIPFVATSADTVKRAARAMPEEILREFLGVLRAEFASLEFEVYSSKRGEGVALMVGSRFVTPDRAEEVAKRFLESVPGLAVRKDTGALDRGILDVPRHMRLKDSGQYPVFTFLLLPLVLVGAERDVEYASMKLWVEFPFGVSKNAVARLIAEIAPGFSPDAPVPVVPWHRVADVVDRLMERLEEESGGAAGYRPPYLRPTK